MLSASIARPGIAIDNVTCAKCLHVTAGQTIAITGPQGGARDSPVFRNVTITGDAKTLVLGSEPTGAVGISLHYSILAK